MIPDSQRNSHIEVSIKLRSIFSHIDDPRSDINKLHKLEDILLIGIISVICAADTWKDMETFAKAKEDFLRTFLDLPNGIPSYGCECPCRKFVWNIYHCFNHPNCFTDGGDV